MGFLARFSAQRAIWISVVPVPWFRDHGGSFPHLDQGSCETPSLSTSVARSLMLFPQIDWTGGAKFLAIVFVYGFLRQIMRNLLGHRIISTQRIDR